MCLQPLLVPRLIVGTHPYTAYTETVVCGLGDVSISRVFFFFPFSFFLLILQFTVSKLYSCIPEDFS